MEKVHNNYFEKFNKIKINTLKVRNYFIKSFIMFNYSFIKQFKKFLKILGF